MTPPDILRRFYVVDADGNELVEHDEEEPALRAVELNAEKGWRVVVATYRLEGDAAITLTAPERELWRFFVADALARRFNGTKPKRYAARDAFVAGFFMIERVREELRAPSTKDPEVELVARQAMGIR